MKKLIGFLNQLFRKEVSSNHDSSEQCIIVHFQYGHENLAPLHALESQLVDLLTGSKMGEYDGHEIATDYSDGFLYLYGPNAELLFAEIKHTLEITDFMRRAVAKLRFGPPDDGVRETEFRFP